MRCLVLGALLFTTACMSGPLKRTDVYSANWQPTERAASRDVHQATNACHEEADVKLAEEKGDYLVPIKSGGKRGDLFAACMERKGWYIAQ